MLAIKDLTAHATVRIALAGAILALHSTQAAPPSSDLQRLFKEEWDYELRTSPELATMIGDKRFNAELSDLSPAFQGRDRAQMEKFLRAFQGVRDDGLSDVDKLNRRLMMRRLETHIADIDNKVWEMPVDQMNGIQLGLAQLPSFTSFSEPSDYRDYVSRLHKIPRAFAQLEETLRVGMADGRVPPKYLLEKAQAQTENLAKAEGDKNPFLIPAKKAPAAEAAEIRSAVTKDVRPAYERLAQFLKTTYVPAGRS